MRLYKKEEAVSLQTVSFLDCKGCSLLILGSPLDRDRFPSEQIGYPLARRVGSHRPPSERASSNGGHTDTEEYHAYFRPFRETSNNSLDYVYETICNIGVLKKLSSNVHSLHL